MTQNWKAQLQAFDHRRDLALPGDAKKTVAFAAAQFIAIAQAAIQERGFFAVAVSGGNTPRPVYQLIASPEYRSAVDWSKVLLFWSDERAVPPTHPESNYKMTMESGFNTLPLDPKHIFRMEAEHHLEQSAQDYEKLIHSKAPGGIFDLVILGMGDDGHIASLFPHTHGLHAEDRLVIGNYIPQKETWRMSLTYPCINQARNISLYVLGAGKSATLAEVLAGPYQPDTFPAQKVGTPDHKATWIIDRDAATIIQKAQPT